MNATPPIAVPGWFRAAATLLLLWNLFGVWSLYTQYTMTPEAIAALPGAQRAMWQAMPGWLWIAYAVAVGAGTLGALLLLLRRRAAVPLFALSLVAVVVQFGVVLFPAGGLALMGPAQALPMPLTIIAVAALALWLSLRARRRGWIS